MTYAEMIKEVKEALVTDNFEYLEHLRDLDAGWYHDIIENFIVESLETAVKAFEN